MTSLLLALLALLAPRGGAGVGPPLHHCPQSLPIITATTAAQTSYAGKLYERIVLDSNYCEEITVFCTGTSSNNLTILNEDQQLQTKFYNITTVQGLLYKLNVGEHKYYCADNSCNNSLTVTVNPAVTVTAPHVHYKLGKYRRAVYFVPHGENYNVTCTAHDVESLSLSIQSSDFEELETKVVNSTTIIATVTAVTGNTVRDYVCEKDSLSTYFKVIMDFNPEAHEFRCVFHLNRKFECSWTSSSERNIFSLSMLYPIESPLCSDMSGAISAGCARAWNDELDNLYVFHENVTIQLNACNEVFCKNQTFIIATKSIIKVDPIYNLKLLNTSSRSAEVAWRHKNYLCYRSCDYKIKYRLGTRWGQANVSSLGCYDLSRDVSCKLHLALPCPNSHYELRVYVKPRSAQDWSDPASMLFFNAPSRFEEVRTDECVADFMESASTDVLQEARQLISDLNLNFNQKLEEIKALLDKHA